MIEIIGYVGMLITILSFLYKNIERVRIINSVACIVWIIYGVLRISYPVILVNSIVLIIHGYWLIKNRKK